MPMLFNESELPETSSNNNAYPNDNAYVVLARKYRPQTLDTLIGQDAMVKILRNAFAHERIAQAFVLTGLRGIGKTTTARILAKCLNCENSDKATATPCGTCNSCITISQDRHIDVIERDAASHTGVNDMRELIDGVKYLPAQGRYKVYIIDEAHMLSNSAWNALLKTLEEPPAHTRFIFATTEIHKIPITVLSRCQRFDLRRLDIKEMMAHLAYIAQQENVKIDEDALALLAKASEGSVRDGLSLLDQAILLNNSQETITGENISHMLAIGMHDKIYDMMACITQGNAEKTFEYCSEFYQLGNDPKLIIHEMMDITHLITRYKISPSLHHDKTIPENHRNIIITCANTLSMAYVGRLWQIMLKGINDLQYAPQPQQAFEMLIARLLYVRDLPPPGDIKRWFFDQEKTKEPLYKPEAKSISPQSKEAASSLEIDDFNDILHLLQTHDHMDIYQELQSKISVKYFSIGHISLTTYEKIPQDFIRNLTEILYQHTQQNWNITLDKIDKNKKNDDNHITKNFDNIQKSNDTAISQKDKTDDADTNDKINTNDKLKMAQSDPVIQQIQQYLPESEIIAIESSSS